MKNLEKYLSLLDCEADGLLLTSRYSRHYCAEFDIAEGMAVVSKSGCRYFTDSRYLESAQKNIRDFTVLDVGAGRGYVRRINEAISDFGITCLGYEEKYLTAEELLSFEEELKAPLLPISGKLNAFRDVKEPWELERMKNAQAITDKAFAEILTKIRPGMTELALQAELIYAMYKNGATGLAFDPIVISGPNTSLPHGVAGERVIQPGDFITMDFGAAWQGYCSDMTRTVAVGSASAEMRYVYSVVLEAQQTAIEATKAGLTGAEIDAIARNVIAKAGYGGFFGHSYGHGLGLEIHEGPNLSPRYEKPIPAGAVCSAEPGIYLPGKFGVRIEDVTVISENGTIDMTKSPKNLIIV